MSDFYQFYPTPLSLASRLVSLFKHPYIKLLEPHAGNGDLLRPLPHGMKQDVIDLIELDISRHDVLRQKGTIVGTDFMDTKDLSMYSHILMNPPFRVGVKHVLHAWKGIFVGEIAAIINATGLRNPTTADEQRLADLVKLHGSVEFVEAAFTSPDTQRKTEVEIAMVYLEKKRDGRFWDSDILTGLEADKTEFAEVEKGTGLAISNGQVVELVRAFNATWEARKRKIIAEERSYIYDTFFRAEVRKIVVEDGMPFEERLDPLHKRLSASYSELKRAAWISVLNTSDFRKYLTSKVIKQILSDFEPVCSLAFTEANIYGFMQGFAMNQGDFQQQAILNFFDQVVHRYSDNCVLYKSWKSNEKHQIGMALQRRRFILGGFSLDGWRSTLDYFQKLRLQEIDRVMAILDGKNTPQVGLSDLFEHQMDALRNGQRLSGTYFEVRFYPGIGTIHFFPRDQKMIDRINIIVGKARQWIPENYGDEVDQAAYKSAEKVNAKVMKKIGWQALHDPGKYEEEVIELMEKAELEIGQSAEMFPLIGLKKAS
ncbi:hypothetical protein A6M27_12855 [Acidithiobacillus thiooxidans]|uniref:DUF4942 domain-containing protein n=3 Tax=Acidithiobacillus thiooxidans TaxID=930 RepID=A0A1C2J2V6_ACITH|nr:DUF4942 domain-containing protein [Acidithiobacillus thiooxidans]OCX68199.1 hypothetical protein A6O24_19895 [Acidithiobacillus thiooxidans]OCX72910.1 hypothetical protein A6M23_08995 [Acidithiobacillus thiooxidans]OCX73984.1 hypothetical protein A6P07_06815 [Acidithiobacillus thiooxidans]OCX81109.1 hypothetical protein A6P08_14525 [Acidithiobacillus thiooxidans]OCX82578.1 hypothetical protein A6O26_09555 [Acidithiobacillus thiooxidans]